MGVLVWTSCPDAGLPGGSATCTTVACIQGRNPWKNMPTLWPVQVRVYTPAEFACADSQLDGAAVVAQCVGAWLIGSAAACIFESAGKEKQVRTAWRQPRSGGWVRARSVNQAAMQQQQHSNEQDKHKTLDMCHAVLEGVPQLGW